MDVTYGSVDTVAPEGFLPRRVHFTSMVKLDTPTQEGMLRRTIESAGFGTRELPITIDGAADGRGHEGAVPVGRVDQVRINGANVEGWGWLLDTSAGELVFSEALTKVLRGSSIVMADAKARIEFNFDEEEMTVDVVFEKANMAAITQVKIPAFADSRMEIEDLTAALEVPGDLEVELVAGLDVPEPADEMVAAGSIVQPYDHFFMPEAPIGTPSTVDEHGRVFGHLGLYDSCHTGWVDRCVRIPRSPTGYSAFNMGAIDTDNGSVYTGPIFLLGGHDFTRKAIEEGVNNVENAWADVRIIDGKLGPWMSGVVRPGISAERLYAAKASRVSGHWLNKGRGLDLHAIASVNAEGFNVPRAMTASFEMGGNERMELIAGFTGPCGQAPAPPPGRDPDEIAALLERARQAVAA